MERAHLGPWRALLLVALAVALALALVGRARADDAPPMIHIDLDFAVFQTEVDFVDSSDVLAECLPPIPCGVDGFTTTTARASGSIGLGSLNLEGSLSVPLDLPGVELVTWSAGLRIDSSQDGWLSLQLRLAYVGRLGDVEGQGARAGLGLIVRPAWWISLYAEASAEATSVPTTFNDMGALFSYATHLGGGLRLSFGR